MRCTLTVVSLGVLLATASPVEDSTGNVFGRCILPLGMEEGKIPDDAITASSSYETKSVGPQNARIRQEKNGGAWCPKAQISSAIREYLEIDLTRNHLIAWTETQGRYGNGQGQEYAETFFLEYWREAAWHQYKTLTGERVLRGNSNTYLVEKQKLDLPFVASRVRFVPYSQHPRTVCMRVEIYGCIWEQYVTSYSAPKASNPGPGGCDVRDSSYDGVEVDSLLANGLGQLTDGILGDLSEMQTPGTDTNWVGWSERATVELLFYFQELRQFENCTLHVARIPELEVEMFSAVRISFSVDGDNYEMETEGADVSVDASSSMADTVSTSIPLRSKIGRMVKMELSLAGKWLLLSEVTFNTGSRNRSADSYSSMDRNLRVERNRSDGRPKTSNSPSSISTYGSNDTGVYQVGEDSSTPDAFPVGSSQTYIGLVSGLLTVVALLLTGTAFFVKQRGRNKVALLQKHTAALLCDSSTSGIGVAPKDRKLSTSIANGLSLIRKPIVIASTDSLPDRAIDRTLAQISCQSVDLSADHRRRSSLYETTYNLFTERDGRATESCSDFKCNSSFAANRTATPATITAATTTTCASKKTLQLQSGKVNRRTHGGYYAATDILTIKKREPPLTFSPFTPVRICERAGHLPRTTVEPYAANIPRVSRHRLRMLDKLGEGNFGLVHLCEAKGITNPEVGTIENGQTVIVRSLWRGVVKAIRLDFARDMQFLATLENPNVAKMMALVEEEPVGAVFEYSQFGDLPAFLDSYRFRDGNDHVSGRASPINFLVQIASAMRYLESMNIAHCDLAARNCIVGQQLTIKVSDHAVYCSKYDRHYFIDGSNAKLPLRWMAWEAVLMGKRSCQADVWSFAVTAWEILTNCREIPYSDLSSAQVFANFAHWYRSEACSGNKQKYDGNDTDEGNQLRVPPQPDRCSDDLYLLMRQCWSKRCEDRPSFEDIHRYLERLPLD